MLTTGRASCIVFLEDDLPPKGSDQTRPLHISIGCLGRCVPSVLLDNGSTLNVCPLATAIALGYGPTYFEPSTQTLRAYDSTRREVMGTLTLELVTPPPPLGRLMGARHCVELGLFNLYLPFSQIKKTFTFTL